MRRSTHCFIAYKLLVIDLQTYRVEGGWECTLWIPGNICISFGAGQDIDNRLFVCFLDLRAYIIADFSALTSYHGLHYSKVIMKIAMLIWRYFIKYIVIFNFVAQSFQSSFCRYYNTVLRPYCQAVISNIKLSTRGYCIPMTYGLQILNNWNDALENDFVVFLWTYIMSD